METEEEKMKRLPERVSFDPVAFVEINRKRYRELLEFVLAEFQVIVSYLSIRPYLLGKAYLGKDVKEEFQALKEAYLVIPPTEELFLKAVEIEARLIKRGFRVSFEDLMVAVTAIQNDALLVAHDSSTYRPLEKYGLNVISLGTFFEEIREFAREEARKWSLTASPERE